jgi:heat shock protein HtpX
MLIQMAISRSREYLADATGAGFAGNPEGLARALEKLGTYSRRVSMDANPATAHMFISNPLSGRGVMSLFSTHPPMQERISRLRGTPNTRIKSDRGTSRMESEAKNLWKRLSDD